VELLMAMGLENTTVYKLRPYGRPRTLLSVRCSYPERSIEIGL